MEKRSHTRDYRVMARPSTTQATPCAPPLNPKRLSSAQIDRNAYREEASAMVRKQRSKIEFLVQQNNALKETVINFYHKNFAELLDAAPPRPRGGHDAAQLREAIAASEEELKALNQQIEIFQKQLVAQKQKMAGGAAPLGAPRSLLKALKTMEDRLDQATQKFNKQVTDNAQLRRQIDSFKKERNIFQNLYRKVENELRRKTQHAEQAVADCREVYDERDALTDRIAQVKELAKREMRDFEHELRDLIALKDKNASNALALASLNETNKAARAKKTSLGGQEAGLSLAEPERVSERAERLKLDLAKLKLVSRVQQPAALLGELEHIQQANFERYNSILVLASELEWLEAQAAGLQRNEKLVADLAQPQAALRREGICESQSGLQHYALKNAELQAEVGDLQNQLGAYEHVFAELHRELCGAAPDPEAGLEEWLSQTERMLLELLVIIGTEGAAV